MFFYKRIYKPGSVANGHLSGHIVADMFVRFKKKQSEQLFTFFNLAPCEVYMACFVTKTSVSSYFTFPPLPFK